MSDEMTAKEKLAALSVVFGNVAASIVDGYTEVLGGLAPAVATKRPEPDEHRASGTRTHPNGSGALEGDE